MIDFGPIFASVMTFQEYYRSKKMNEEQQTAQEKPEAAEAAQPQTPAPEAEEKSPEAPAQDAADKASAEAEAQIAALKDRLLRLQADFDNFRKRQIREREEWIKQSNADLIEELLPALDHTDSALASLQKTAESDPENPYLKGFELVRKTFLDALAKFGLKPLDSTVGKPLDPNTTEALSVMKTGQTAPGNVLFEMRRGYELNGKLLRSAQAVVEQEDEAAPAAEPAKSESEPAEEAPKEA